MGRYPIINIDGLFDVITLISWIITGLIIIREVMRSSRVHGFVTAIVTGAGLLSRQVLVSLLFSIIFGIISAGLVFIQPQEVGMVISALSPRGYRAQPLNPGLKWVFPFLEQVVRYPIYKQTYTMSKVPLEGQAIGDDSVSARTADGQEILLDASVIFQVDPEQAVNVHISWQGRYVEDLVRPMARGVIRDAVSQFEVAEVYSTQRFEMTRQISETMRARFIQNGLLLDEFILRNITFPPEYAKSIENKQIAEQQAQEAEFVVLRKKQEAQQIRELAKGEADAEVILASAHAESRVVRAQAEAQALQLIANVLENQPELLTHEYIRRLAPSIRTMLIPNDTPLILPMPSLDDSSAMMNSVEQNQVLPRATLTATIEPPSLNQLMISQQNPEPTPVSTSR